MAYVSALQCYPDFQNIHGAYYLSISSTGAVPSSSEPLYTSVDGMEMESPREGKHCKENPLSENVMVTSI